MATRIDKYGQIIRDDLVQPPRQTYTQPPRQTYTPQYQFQSNNPSSLPFYVITLVISAIVAWILSGFVSVLVFNPNKAQSGVVSEFLNDIGPYVIFLVGIGGCLWYNTKRAVNFGTSEIFLSVLFTAVACFIAGAALFLLSVVIKFIVIIIIVVVVFAVFVGG